MRWLAVLVLPLLLAGCDAANDAADAIARDRAKAVVNGIVAQRFPGVTVAPVTDCIIDAASAGEIITIARDSVGGVKLHTRKATGRCTRPSANCRRPRQSAIHAPPRLLARA